MALLRYRADRRTLAFVFAWFAFEAAAWMGWSRLGLAARAALVVLLAAHSWLTAVITHNTLHSPVFHSRALNRLFQGVLSLTYGFPVSEYVPGHNLSHHRYLESRRDVMRTSKVRFRWHLLNLLFFFFAVGLDVTAANLRYAREAKGRSARWNRQRLWETAATWSVKLLLLALDWRRALWLVWLPHLWAVWGITTVNLLQHDGCDADHPANHSRNFTGRAFNWLTFNNGFHGIHHDEPGLHWSLLAGAHAERVRPLLDPRLEERSLAGYLVRTFVWPGKRVRFDGAPLVLLPEGPDEDWIRGTLARDSTDPAEAALPS
jgi:fatty acid desaturase